MDYILRFKVDDEFYNDYIDKFGKESVENYYKYFTNEEQIKRYTDNIIFWIERIPKQTTYRVVDRNITFTEEMDNEDYIRLEMSTDKLRTLVEKIKGTDFEKDVINNIYLKFPEYVSLCRPLRELALRNEIMTIS
jgi:hypothetical protein